MGTLLESAEAFKARALEVGISQGEVKQIIRQGTNTLARLAFACCPPGQSATDDQVRELFPDPNTVSQGVPSSVKRLVFEAQTLVVADVKQKVA